MADRRMTYLKFIEHRLLSRLAHHPRILLPKHYLGLLLHSIDLFLALARLLYLQPLDPLPRLLLGPRCRCPRSPRLGEELSIQLRGGLTEPVPHEHEALREELRRALDIMLVSQRVRAPENTEIGADEFEERLDGLIGRVAWITCDVGRDVDIGEWRELIELW